MTKRESFMYVALTIVLALSLFIVSPVSAKSEKIKFMSKNLGNYSDVMDGITDGKDIEVYGKLTFPKNVKNEQVPCMIYMHGSGGYKTKRNFQWIELFLDMGIATFKVDSFKARGVSSTGGKQSSVESAEMAVDVYKALEVLSNNPRIDKNRIGIIGNSKGGMVSLVTMWKPLKDIIGVKETFALHVSLYGVAMDFEPFELTGAPLLSLVGAKDDYTAAKPWVPLVDKMQTNGYDAQVVVYKGAYHAFDAKFPLKKYKKGYSYKDCEFKLYDDGRFMEVNSDLEGDKGIIDCRCKKKGVMLGGNDNARQDSMLRVSKFVKTIFNM